MPQHRYVSSPDQPAFAAEGPPEEGSQTPSQYQSPPLSIPDKILQFLNALPTTGNAAEWIGAFHALLTQLFDDVDHVEVRVNLHCPLVVQDGHPPSPPAAARARIRRSPHSVEDDGPLVVTTRKPDDLEDDRYQQPASFEYLYRDEAYLGTVLLRREEGKEAISSRTHMMMRALEPFMIFALSDLVARYSYSRPISKIFHEVLHGIALERQLTRRELQVLTLHLFGRKYDEIASRLYISIDTVKKHVKRIHRKTGARSATELFARYFTPLIDTDDEPLWRRKGGEEDFDI